MTLKTYLILLLSFSFSLCLTAQEGIDFKASVSSKKVLEGETFNIKFVLSNATGTAFKAPDFKNLKIVGGPAQGSGSQTINNRTSSYVSVEYSVRPTKLGKITIGSASVKANGKTMASAPITIEVVKKRNIDAPGSEPVKDFFIKTELDTSRVYVGQQLGVNYLMYATERIQNRNVVSFPDYDEFFLIYLNDPYFDTKRDIIDGVAYNIKTVRSIALFPFQSGVFEIEAMKATAGVLLPGSFLSRYKRKELTSEPYKITVLPLPEPKPDNFSNGVGHYTIQAKTNKNYAVLGESIVLTVLVEGDGIPKTFVMPELDLGEDFEVYGPELVNESSENLNPTFNFQKQYEFTIVPKKIGRQAISYEMSYFDTDSSSYQTLRSPRFVCNVVASNKATEIAEAKSEELIFNKELAPPSNSWHKIDKRFFGTPLFWTLSMIPLISLGFLNIWKWRTGGLNFMREKEIKVNTDERLKELSNHLDKNDAASFYQSIRKIFHELLVEHSNDPSITLTVENFKKTFEKHPNMSESEFSQFEVLFKQMELARFGGFNPSNLSELYQTTELIISKLNKY